jgi:ATP-dependent Clp protease, protease subunit
VTEPRPPEIPYPFPPLHESPPRRDPVMVPIVYEPAGRDPVRRLFERRQVLMGAPLDAAAVTDIAAQVMSLDGRCAGAIELLVNSPGGPVEEVFAVLDVISLARAKVDVTCFGRALGTAAIVLACATGARRATPNATISLRCEQATAMVGSAGDAEQRAAYAQRIRQRLVGILGAATELPAARLEHELDDGGRLGAATALELGIIDEIVTRPAT